MPLCCNNNISTNGTSRWKNEPAYGPKAYKPTAIEHGANTITHALWIVPSVYFSVVMMSRAKTEAEWVNAILFGGALLSLFSVSTTFHGLSWTGKAETLRFYLHIGDRAVIYLFIAASYTPWLTLLQVGIIGTCLRWLVWILAFLGILYSYCFYEKYKRLETAFYIIMGLGPSIVVFEVNELDGIHELALGGLIYIVGVIFFKSDGIIPCALAIWHIFVVAGASFHFYAINTYLLLYFNFQNELDGIHELALGGLIYIVGVIFFKSDGIIPCAHAIWHIFVVAGASFHFYAINTYLMGSSQAAVNATNHVHHFGERERWP